jgi:hypothetical protein
LGFVSQDNSLMGRRRRVARGFAFVCIDESLRRRITRTEKPPGKRFR